MTELQIQPPDLAAILKRKLADQVREYAANEPRGQQVAIGASQIGNPCDRALALKSLGYEGHNHGGNDPWAAFIGTAVHYRLEKVFRQANSQHAVSAAGLNGEPFPFKIETRVELAPGIRGTADLYDVETCTVIDHKVPADAVMKEALKGHLSATYFVQIQAYGYGFRRLGYDVRNVAVAFWPRGTGAWLGALHVVTFDYDESVAASALERWYQLVNAAIDLDLENHPERAGLLATADAPCRWCPFLDMAGRASQPSCKGHGK